MPLAQPVSSLLHVDFLTFVFGWVAYLFGVYEVCTERPSPIPLPD